MTVSLITQRVLFNQTDISTAVGDFRTSTYSLVYTTSDAIYVGMSTPFNNLWVEFLTASSSSAGAPTIEVWYNQAWSAAIDVVDGTSGMTKSGRISFGLHIDRGWNIEQRATDVTGLSTTEIYNRYWVRIKWGTGFSASIAFIGQKFSNDTMMQTLYPDLMQVGLMEGFKSGKTDWNDQHFMAAEFIIKDMRKRRIILDRGQIFDWSLLEEAATHKCAEIIFYGLGPAHRDNAESAMKRYMTEMNSKIFSVDENMDGVIQPIESVITQGWITR